MKYRILFAICVGLVLTAGPSHSLAQPAPQPRQDAGAPGVIRGRITAADTGRPLRRARISLRAVSAQGRPSAIGNTNSQGVFELKDVPPGSYYVAASRAGYLEVEHGQRRPRERGVAIELNAGETIERIDIALPRAGVLAGRITDEQGEPYPGVRVFAMELRYQNGRRVQYPVGFAETDDLGQYRIPALQPGSFYVWGMSSETWRNEKKEAFGYAATYYPGVASDAAQTITLAVSQQRLDIDFGLAPSRAVRVSGRALRATGEPLAGEAVSLARSVGPGGIATGGGASVRTSSDGSFEIQNIAAADYILQVRTAGEYASVPVSVRGVDITNLVLVTRSGSTVSGYVVIEDGTPPPFPVAGARLFLISDSDAALPTVRLPAVNTDWTIRMTNVGGPFIFRINGLPEDWMLHAVRLGDRDITDVMWDVPTGGREITDLQLVLTQKVGRVSGGIVNADGKPTADATVVVFSEEPAHWTVGSRFIRTARPNSSGQFSIAGLPAGHYLVVARDFIIDGQWENTEFLESVRKDAVRVVLNEGGTESVSLKVR